MSKKSEKSGKKRGNETLLGGKEASYEHLWNIYKTVKIPWAMLLLVLATSLGTQWVAVEIVEYSSRIDTGTMTGGWFLVCYVTLAVLSVLFEYGYDLAGALGNAQMARNVRTRLWGRMLRMPVASFEREEPQRLVSRVTKDATYAYSALSGGIQVISIIYGIVIAIIPMVEIFGAYSWIIAVCIPVLFVCSAIVGKIQYRIDRMINTQYSKMTNFYSERLPNMTYIKTNNMERSEYEKGLEYSQEKYKADIIYKALYALQLPLESLANYIGLVFVLVVSSAMVRGGTLTALEMKQLMLYFEVVMENATLLLGVWLVFKSSHGGSEKIGAINDAEPENLAGADVAAGVDDIVFEHVTFGYTPEVPVLRDVSFTVPAGKTTAIVGENGSGKSTIARLLERFDAPDAGAIRVGGDDLSALDGTQWRGKVGYVFQGNQMVEGTIRENIAYGAPEGATEEDLVRAAADAGALEFINEKPQGLDTPVHVFESELSGGQLQRLAIARAFMKDPDYLVLDEATASIDVVAGEEIMARARERMAGKTLIFVSHDMDVVNTADHVVLLRDGHVEAEGSPDELARTSELFRAMNGEREGDSCN